MQSSSIHDIDGHLAADDDDDGGEDHSTLSFAGAAAAPSVLVVVGTHSYTRHTSILYTVHIRNERSTEQANIITIIIGWYGGPLLDLLPGSAAAATATAA